MGTLQEELVKNGLAKEVKNKKKHSKNGEFLDGEVVNHIVESCMKAKKTIYRYTGDLTKKKYLDPNYFKRHSSKPKTIYQKRRKIMSKKPKENTATFLLLKTLRNYTRENPLSYEEIFKKLITDFSNLKVTEKSVAIYLSTFSKLIPDFVKKTKEGIKPFIMYEPQLTEEDADLDFAYSMFVDNARERKVVKSVPSKATKGTKSEPPVFPREEDMTSSTPAKFVTEETDRLNILSKEVADLKNQVQELTKTIDLLTGYIKKEIILKLSNEEITILNM